MTRLLVLLPLLTSCALFHTDRANDPKSCQERVTRALAASYPDPTLLAKAVATACTGIATP